MAISISTNNIEHAEVVIEEMETIEKTCTKKKRNRRFTRRVKKTSDSSDCKDDYTTESTSDSSISGEDSTINSTRKQQKNKKQIKKKKKKSNKNKPKVERVSLEEQQRYVAIDCEMVGYGYNGCKSMLARVTIIDWNSNILLDEYIKPTKIVTDYRTFVSGITSQHLEGPNALELEVCREKVRNILHDKILIGHALKNDLHALGISHPWYQIRDTGKYEPFMKVRFNDGILWPRKLKELAKEKLQRDIQVEGKAHSPYEDASAALDLYKCVRPKWEKIMTYKVNRTNEILEQKQQTNVDGDSE